jgi:hypothetical protein
MEFKDIITNEVMNVDPEKRVTISELKDEISELKAMVAQLLEEKGV